MRQVIRGVRIATASNHRSKKKRSPAELMFPSELSEEDLECYFWVIQVGLTVQSHADLLQWLPDLPI